LIEGFLWAKSLKEERRERGVVCSLEFSFNGSAMFDCRILWASSLKEKGGKEGTKTTLKVLGFLC
jgi:hypothetical protein